MALAAPTAVPDAPALSPAEARHLQALERRIEKGLKTFVEVGLALLEIRDKQLFRLSHTSFEAYCRDRWSMDRQRAYQLMGAAEVAQILPPDSVANESQARELVPVMNADPALVPKVWDAVVASNEPVTAQVIREAVRKVTGDVVDSNGRAQPAAPITATVKLVAMIEKVTADVEVWKGTHPTRAERKKVVSATEALVTALG